MEASLTCAVCLSLFEDPVTLPVCSHNFCRHCVVECLNQAASVAEPPSPSSVWWPSPRSRDPLQESPRAPGRASRDGGSISLLCPLCRKLCLVPSDGGAAALPVNTTLAEVVKLFRAASSAKPSPEAAEEASSALAPQLAALGGLCEKHPGRPLQLYCRMCRRGGCGQCVSEDHRGVFHSVNLIDTVYQEEKLAFFSNVKKIRELQLKLMKEVSVSPKDEKDLMQNEEELIKTEFEKLCNVLQTRKKELLENLESQKKRKEKEHLIWKNMKEAHRKTVENVLIDCEKLLDECDPQCFLEIACNLNQRMKTQLDLMQMASGHEDQPECKQIQLDTKSIVKDILALTLTEVNLDVLKADIPSGNSEPSVSASPENKWEDKKTIQDMFCPVPGEDVLENGRNIPTQYMSVSATTKFRNMSHEELRYIHYMKREVHSDELQTETLNKRNTLPKFWFSKKAISGTGLFCLGAEANNQKKSKMQMLQRQSANRCSLSDSLGFTFKTQSPNFNFCRSDSTLNIFDTKDTQNDTKKTNLLENANRCLKTEKLLPTHVETYPSKTQFAFSAHPNVSQTAIQPKETSKPVSTGVTEHFSNSGANFTVSTASSFQKKKLVLSTSILENPKNKVCNIRNINGNISSAFSTTIAAAAATTISTTTAISFKPNIVTGKHFSSALSSESNCIQTTKLNISKQSSIPRSFFSNNCTWAGNTPCIHPFKEAFRNNETLTSPVVPFNKTQYAHNKSEFKSKHAFEKKSVSSRKNVPVYHEQKTLVCHSSLFSMDTCLKSQNDSILVPQQNIVCDSSASSTSVSIEHNEDNDVLESQPLPVQEHRSPSILNETNCTPNSDPDVEDVSQVSTASNQSTASEYFSVAEDVTTQLETEHA
ncbi:tripartite motif-containing protein 75 [Liasis olivaceus]